MVITLSASSLNVFCIIVHVHPAFVMNPLIVKLVDQPVYLVKQKYFIMTYSATSSYE
jgi:hypothetical protein